MTLRHFTRFLAQRCGLGAILSYALLTFLALFFLAPIGWMLKTALTSYGSLFALPVRILPESLDFSSFTTIWQELRFPVFYRNSLTVATLATVGQLFSCSFTAFALTNLRFPGRNLALLVILGTMMVPFHVTMVPQFILMNYLGWLDTLLPLWVPAFFGGVTGAFGIFLLRQAFLAIPKELFEAAIVDGANPLDLYWRITLPLAKPQLAVLGVYSFMTSWNDFLAPIIFITSPENITVTGALSFFQTQWHVYWNQLMAGAFLAMVPTLIVYVFAQRYFIETASSSGLKG